VVIWSLLLVFRTVFTDFVAEPSKCFLRPHFCLVCLQSVLLWTYLQPLLALCLSSLQLRSPQHRHCLLTGCTVLCWVVLFFKVYPRNLWIYVYCNVQKWGIYLPGKNLAISAHRLPICLCRTYIVWSSISVHADFLMSGLRWLCHLHANIKLLCSGSMTPFFA